MASMPKGRGSPWLSQEPIGRITLSKPAARRAAVFSSSKRTVLLIFKSRLRSERRPLCSPSTIGSSLFHFLESARPIGLEQHRERAVGEETAVGLAAGAVVRLVLGVYDALHRRAADRAGLAEAAMDGHLRPEGCDLLGQAVPGLLAQTLDPLGQCGARGREEALDLTIIQAPRHFDRRQLGPVQDLVGICIADAAEQPGICEYTFERVVLMDERGAKRIERRREDVHAAGIVPGQGGHAA